MSIAWETVEKRVLEMARSGLHCRAIVLRNWAQISLRYQELDSGFGLFHQNRHVHNFLTQNLQIDVCSS